MITDKQQEAIDRLAIIISNYIGETDVGFDNIAILDGLYDTLHISSDLKNWWKARVAKALLKTNKEDK